MADYYRFWLGKIKKLSPPVRNIIPRRISFGFTTLDRLLNSRNILELYDVPPTETIVGKALMQTGVKAVAQHYVPRTKKTRYRLDFAIFCKKGKIAIECDNVKAHSGKRQQQKDRAKDKFLRHHGWTIVRLKEREITSNVESCIAKVQKAIRKLGSQNPA